jgi:hypothetical protein
MVSEASWRGRRPCEELKATAAAHSAEQGVVII